MVLDNEYLKKLHERGEIDRINSYINEQLKSELDILVSAFNRGLDERHQLIVWRRLRELRSRFNYDKENYFLGSKYIKG